MLRSLDYNFFLFQSSVAEVELSGWLLPTLLNWFHLFTKKTAWLFSSWMKNKILFTAGWHKPSARLLQISESDLTSVQYSCRSCTNLKLLSFIIHKGLTPVFQMDVYAEKMCHSLQRLWFCHSTHSFKLWPILCYYQFKII